MRKWVRIGRLGVLTGAAMAACTMKNANLPPDELMRQFQAGQPMLDCQLDCSVAWGSNHQKVRTLDATGRWQDLALLVIQIGYMNDLSYYYLGHAAENLGYWQAAQRYYRIAERLSVTQMSCAQGEANIATTFGLPANLCDGYSFPDALYPHLEVVEARLAAPSAAAEPSAAATSTSRTRVKRLVHKQPSQTTTAESAPAVGKTPASGFVEPTPTAIPTSATGFVEPSPSTADAFAPPPVRR
jgi:hypothetical protein